GSTPTDSEHRGYSHRSFAGERGHVEARSLVRQANQGRSPGRSLPPQAGRNRTGSPRLPDHPLLRVGILAAHLTTGEPQILAHWAATASAGEVSLLRRNDADGVFALDGKETPGGAHDGGQVRRRGVAEH